MGRKQGFSLDHSAKNENIEMEHLRKVSFCREAENCQDVSYLDSLSEYWIQNL